MRIEITERGTKEAYEEIVSAVMQYRQLIRKPERKLKNYVKQMYFSIVLCVVLLLMLVFLIVSSGLNAAIIVGIVLLGIALIFSCILLANIKKMVNTVMNDTRTSILILDENGVEVSKEDGQTIRMPWENAAFARCFKHSICFFDRNMTGFVISAGIQYKDQLLGYIRDNHIGIRVIE